MRARDRISAKPRTKRGARAVPVVVADRPDAAWSWDITDLPSPWVGVHFKAYAVTDIYSRKIVAHRVELKQCKDLAAQMFQQAFAQAIPGVVHADNGAAMIAGTTKKTLKAYGVTPSYSRPRVSNDNPFSEAVFATIKTDERYPGVFHSLEGARQWFDRWVSWYNNEHKHTRIGFYTPAQVYDGTWSRAWCARQRSLDRYYEKNRCRFRKRPKAPMPKAVEGINLTVLKTA